MVEHLYRCSATAVVVAALSSFSSAAVAQVVEPDGTRVVTAEERSAQPEDGVEDEKQDVDLEYRVWGESLDLANFDGDANDQLNAAYQRARADVGVEFGGSFALRLEADVFSGRIAGDAPPENPAEFQPSGTRAGEGEAFADIENFLDPRNAYIEYQSLVLLRVGLQTSEFGLGLVANDGAEDDSMLFNQQYGGDRSFRALLGTRPFAVIGTKNRTAQKITMAVGGDVVYRDDNAAFLDEDRARQAIASIYYSDQNPSDPEDTRFLGTYFAYRNQTDADGDTLRAAAFDIAGTSTWNDDNGMWFYSLGFETTLLTGETTRTFPQTGDFETNVLSFGAAGEAEVRWKPLDMSVKLGAGYASGDANPDDDTLYRHRFDPNYKVGLILFDHYLPAVTRTGYARATDPSRSGEAPKGVEGLVSDGAVENAVYVNPMLLFGNPEGLLTGVGFLWAQSAVPLYDPYNSFANGGSPTGVRGTEASRDLGFEVDVAARYRHTIVSKLQIEAKLEYGLFFPGKAFADAQGDLAAPQNLARGRLALLW